MGKDGLDPLVKPEDDIEKVFFSFFMVTLASTIDDCFVIPIILNEVGMIGPPPNEQMTKRQKHKLSRWFISFIG
jgi:hypothetical protein